MINFKLLGTVPQRKQLKKGAVPSMFTWSAQPTESSNLFHQSDLGLGLAKST